ncbi:MAG TPA: hypothetical protein EYQ53_06865 [Candidatus Poseidoniales archaeon]|nr:hypothetical protein [Candidatus Poseidoniales archaeon]HIK78663.1 hypothetical protein [Candidatus Poseidoniales archaeon]
MGMKRFLLGLAIIVTIIFYLLNASELTDSGQYGVIGLLISESILFLWMPKKIEQKVVRKRRSTGAQVSGSVSVLSSEEEMDLPEIVTVDSLDGASLKERKMAKIKAKALESSTDDEDEEELTVVEVEVEIKPDVHLAEEFVVEVNPQSIEDADIEDAVSDRLEMHDRIRMRIEDRRRSQMASIRASTAKMWEEHDEGEDLIAVLSNPQHGLTILNEPAEVEPGHPYGSTFIRINDESILRLRIPLDSGYRAIGEDDSEDEMPILIGPDGLPLPPLPLPGELGLPPPPGAPGMTLPELPLPAIPAPISGAQSALAEMRDDMVE